MGPWVCTSITCALKIQDLSWSRLNLLDLVITKSWVPLNIARYRPYRNQDLLMYINTFKDQLWSSGEQQRTTLAFGGLQDIPRTRRHPSYYISNKGQSCHWFGATNLKYNFESPQPAVDAWALSTTDYIPFIFRVLSWHLQYLWVENFSLCFPHWVLCIRQLGGTVLHGSILCYLMSANWPSIPYTTTLQ